MGEWWEDGLTLDDVFADECSPEEHDWQLSELVGHLRGMDRAFQCSKCPAVRYEPSTSYAEKKRLGLL